MHRTAFDRRPSRRTVAALTFAAVGVVGLLALASVPAFADGSPTGLALAPLASIDGVKPGSSFQVRGTFANKGTADLDKVYLSYSVTRGLAHQELPSNCVRYEIGSYDEAPSHSRAVCEFDQMVKAGSVYAPEKALRLNVLDHALYDTLHVGVSMHDSGALDGTMETVRGTGPAVKLTELPADTPVGDVDPAYPEADAIEVPVTADNTADFQVTGARLAGRVGDTVDLEVKFTNAGPGWVSSRRETSVSRVLIKMPAGTTVTEARSCTKVATGSYSCGFGNFWAEENSVFTYRFKLRIDKAMPGARGSVALNAQDRPYDTNKKNDSAAILLDVDSIDGSTSGNGSTGGSGSTSTTGGSGSTGGSDSSGGSTATGASGASATGGGMADTGSDSVLPLTGAAAAILAAGAGAVVVVRRRAARN